MGAKPSRPSTKINYYIEGKSQIPQPGMRFKSQSGKIYQLDNLLSETDNSFNFLAFEWIPSIIDDNNQITQHIDNSKLEKLFVVKFIKLYYDKIHMIQNELTMMKTFAKLGNNNNIVECYDYFVSSQESKYPYVCIVTPYAQGGTLLDYLHLFRHTDQSYYNTTENTIKKIMHQLLLALKYLHSNNVAHRDLNLKNIFLINKLLSQNSSIGTINDVDPIIALADFGCATFIDDKENCDEVDEEENENCNECDEGCDHCKDQMKKNSGKTTQKTARNLSQINKKKYVLNQLVGTPVFIAPEMYEGKPYGVEVDIWSLGIVLYALMSGRSPFPSTPNIEVMKWLVIHKQIEFPEEQFQGFSESAISLLKMMLNKDPSKRITAEAALLHPWFTELSI